MQPAEHGDRRDRAGEPGSDPFARERKPLVDPLVGPSRGEVAQCAFSDNLLQVRLGQDDQVIEAFAPDAPQKAFAHRIHQRRLHRRAQDAEETATPP